MRREWQVVGFLLALFFNHNLYSGGREFLCGSDEDGCYDYRFCACIPVNEMEFSKAYCLDFDGLTCVPLSQTPSCSVYLTFKDQGACLGTIFQSEPFPGCSVVSHAFCVEHHIALCDRSGYPGSCKS